MLSLMPSVVAASGISDLLQELNAAISAKPASMIVFFIFSVSFQKNSTIPPQRKILPFLLPFLLGKSVPRVTDWSVHVCGGAAEYGLLHKLHNLALRPVIVLFCFHFLISIKNYLNFYLNSTPISIKALCLNFYLNSTSISIQLISQFNLYLNKESISKLLSQFNFYLNKDSMSTPISIQLPSQ